MAKIGAFRFWCQKVLPLVYDDSISYYELLNKVVVYLNNVISDFNTVAENFDNLDAAFDTLQESYNDTKNALLSAYDQLQSYVNNYFDNLDVQEEINNKLDEMAEDGSLSDLLEPFISAQISSDVASWLAEHITPTSPAVDSSLTVSGAAAEARTVGFFRADTLQAETDNLLKLNFFSRGLGGTGRGYNRPDGIYIDGAVGSGVYILSDPVELPAGSYRYGFITPMSASACQLQVRSADSSGADTGSVGQTAGSATFTLSEATRVYARIRVYGVDISGLTLQPYIKSGTDYPEYYVKGGTASDLVARGTLANVFKTGDVIADGTDLDTITTPGFYRGGQRRTYGHAPLSGVAFNLFVLGQVNSPIVTQFFMTNDYGNNEQWSLYSRFLSGSPATWKEWATLHTPVTSVTGGTDLNTLTASGAYGFSSNTEYPNMPADAPASYRKILQVFHRIGTSYVTQMMYVYLENKTMQFYIRARSGSPATWQPWTKFYDSALLDEVENLISDNTSMIFSPAAYESGPANTGQALRILSYNVAKWNKDTSTYISDARLFNVRDFLSRYQPDITATQEDGPIDGSGGSKPVEKWVFNPAQPYHYGGGQCCLHSRIAAAVNVGVVWMQSTRPLRSAIYTINSKRVLVCSVHPLANKDSTGSSSPESVAERVVEYTQLFDWVMGRIQLNLYPNNTPTSCPAWDAAIICGDFNTITSDDKTTLASLAAADGFTMANGGYLGWLESEVNQNGEKALDNVIVKGCVINGVRSFKSWYDKLYSDHYPFLVDLTVL